MKISDVRDRLEVRMGDITRIRVDAIVNAANSSLMGGGGVDGAIHRAGGSEILQACKTIIENVGPCDTGNAVVTTAGRLPAKYVIHTVGPVWKGGKESEAHLLASCYTNSLQLAVANACLTISFPCISTGVYGYPPERAAKIAVSTIKDFLADDLSIHKVLFVCFDAVNYHCILAEIGAR